MKKILCVSAVAMFTLFGVIPATHAQFKFTPEVGIAIMKEGNSNGRATVSPRLGVGVDYFFNKQENGWAVSSGLYYYYKREFFSYAQATFVSEDGKEHTIPFPYPKGVLNDPCLEYVAGIKQMKYRETNSRRDYLQLPVMAKYKWQFGEDCSFSVAAGFFFALGVGGNYNAWVSDVHMGQNETYGEEIKSNVYDIYDRLDAGISTRLSFQVRHFSLHLNYESNCLKKVAWMGDEHLISISTGYTF
ncbi:outer membrane beta-barrel protein [Parabacteroides sp. An277]|uniref:outer membrane beta-barrel protein n=1 Tax=Parabacteroides sp. An277 TaxID=1965619 RepID=UPI0013A653BB|nr:outer membrane beta-barrel protein [Parabacteroides sp. An277]